jgi:hypothetical protein
VFLVSASLSASFSFPMIVGEQFDLQGIRRRPLILSASTISLRYALQSHLVLHVDWFVTGRLRFPQQARWRSPSFACKAHSDSRTRWRSR